MADATMRKVTKKHCFTLDPPSDYTDLNAVSLEASLSHNLSQPRGHSLADYMVLPPLKGAPIRLVVVLCVEGEVLERREAVKSPVMKLISEAMAKYEARLALCAVEQLSEGGEEGGEVLYDLTPAPYLPFASPTFSFKPHAHLNSIHLTLFFSSPSSTRRSPSPETIDEAIHVPIKELVMTTPLALSVAGAVETAMERTVQGQMGKRWPWMFNAHFRENFKRDVEHYTSISSSLCNILRDIDQDELRLLRRRDRAFASLKVACRPVPAAETPEQADDSDTVEKPLFTTLCRLHTDLLKPSKLTDQANNDAPKPDAPSDLDLDLEADPMPVDRAPSLAAEASNAGSDFEDILGGDLDAEDGDEDEMLLDALSDHIAPEEEEEAFLFDEAWSDSEGEGMLDMDGDSFDD